jgi:hypothetical protein
LSSLSVFLLVVSMVCSYIRHIDEFSCRVWILRYLYYIKLGFPIWLTFCSFGYQICASHDFWCPRPSASPSILCFVLFLDLAERWMFCSLVVVDTWSGHMPSRVIYGRKISVVKLQTIQHVASYCQLYNFFPLIIFRRGFYTVDSLILENK